MNAVINREVRIIDLGLIDYQSAWDFQTRIFNEILALKVSNRSLSEEQQIPTPNYLVLCEHPHVFTLGKSGDEKNLLVTPDMLKQLHASYVPINRGGDITYHGPGHIVAYPLIDLENFFTDIHRYMRTLEEGVIQTLENYQVAAGRIPGLTGVWLDVENPEKARKICALGVKTSRWVTMHGLAFNVNTNLSFFEYIVPCGIKDKGVTSLQKELGHFVAIEDVKNVLINRLIALFGMTRVESEHSWGRS